RLLAGDAARQGIQPLRRGGDHGARRQDASRHGRDRQPGEGRRGTGDPEPEHRARLARGLGPARAPPPLVSQVRTSQPATNAPRGTSASAASPTRETGASAATATRATGASNASASIVLKLGGRALETPGALAECAAAVRGLEPRPRVIVHGGGA